MNKKILILFISIIGLPLLLLVMNGNANPTYGTNHAGCHDNDLGLYSISADLNSINSVNPSEVVVFNITATGPNLFVQARNETTVDGFMHNGQLTIFPTTDRILDNSTEDKDLGSNAMIVTFNITIPDTEEGFYYLFILAGDDTSAQPNFDSVRIGFSVGGVAPPEPEIEIFDHFGLIIGLSALILLSLGTILVLINENKFVKIHGIFSGASWILTLINAISLINLNLGFDLNVLFSFEPFGVHVSHIILGAAGLFTGLLSMLFGIAAERKYAKLTGYITLVCWWTAFFLGLILVPLF
ncbi:MAG: hypothetical protein KGD74_08035 [Candidatus Lokiarchaeota archaeon]|nr:hypothetical protein [Candidatus Lokiarchaeota archaeon]